MTTRDFWSHCASLGLLAFLASWAALAQGVTGRLPLVGALLGFAGSAFYIQYELVRRVQHRSHIAKRGILLRCVLPCDHLGRLGAIAGGLLRLACVAKLGGRDDPQ